MSFTQHHLFIKGMDCLLRQMLAVLFVLMPILASAQTHAEANSIDEIRLSALDYLYPQPEHIPLAGPSSTNPPGFAPKDYAQAPAPEIDGDRNTRVGTLKCPLQTKNFCTVAKDTCSGKFGTHHCFVRDAKKQEERHSSKALKKKLEDFTRKRFF